MTIQDVLEIPQPGRKTVLLFWAPWHEESSGPMTQLLEALESSNSSSSSSSSSIVFGRVEAEQAPSVSSQYQVTMVPTWVFMDENGLVVERMEGVEDVSQVTQAVARLDKRPPASTTTTTTTSSNPLSDSTTAAALVPPISEEEKLKKRLDSLIRSADVMLFMKGAPSAPRCGFSRQIMELLQEEQIPFGSFDILTDEQVRQGLKQYSNWPTYPQLYVNGELIGGLDIIKEMKQEGLLRPQLLGNSSSDATTPESSDQQQDPQTVPLEERLRSLITQSHVMLFMKGLPSAPRCGFSRQMVEILNDEKVDFDAFDILQDNQVREGLKKYSDWPTYPQLYVNGDLIGGLDIVKEMKDDGSLKDLLTKPSS
ncbi:hypothetical protein ACA910_016113 [Epithemia clementina (nom. ined.)]